MNPEDPFLEKDVLESAKKVSESQAQENPIQENQFIRNEPVLKSLPFWVWLFVVAALGLLALGVASYYSGFIQKEKEREPFMEVTNRELSVFLWQFPNFIRSNVSKKTGYTPGFLFDRENFDPKKGDEFVSAPPDLIFLYHTWKRLLAPYPILRSITPEEFDEFLAQLPEWTPENWAHAPEGYVNLINSKDYLKSKDLNTLSQDVMPLVIRQVFVGWKNYFKEGDAINALTPSIGDINTFLQSYPTYARPFWRNITKVNEKDVAGLQYLLFTLDKAENAQEIVPSEQLSAFLKVSLYNSPYTISEK